MPTADSRQNVGGILTHGIPPSHKSLLSFGKNIAWTATMLLLLATTSQAQDVTPIELFEMDVVSGNRLGDKGTAYY
jgi:hypothetical protein